MIYINKRKKQKHWYSANSNSKQLDQTVSRILLLQIFRNVKKGRQKLINKYTNNNNNNNNNNIIIIIIIIII